MKLSPRGIRILLLAAALAGGGLRFGRVFLHETRDDAKIFDEFPYARFGRELNYDHLFAGDSGRPYRIEVERGIGYPAFIASFYSPDKKTHLTRVFSAQAALGTLGVYLVYRIGTAAFCPAAGLLAAFAFAFDPFGVTFTTNTEIETYYTFVLLCLALIFMYAASGPPAGYLLLGAAVGASMLSRTLFFLFPPYLLGLALLARPRPGALALKSLLFCVGFAAALAPWIVSNKAVKGEFSLFQRGEGNHNFYMAYLGSVHTLERDELMAKAREDSGVSLGARTFSEETGMTLSLALSGLAARPWGYLASLAGRAALYGPLLVLLPLLAYRRLGSGRAAGALCLFHLYFSVYLVAAINFKYVMVTLPFAYLLLAGLLLGKENCAPQARRLPYEAALALGVLASAAWYWSIKYMLLFTGKTG